MTILHVFKQINNVIEAERNRIWDVKSPFSFTVQLKTKNILAEKFPELGRERRGELVQDFMALLIDEGRATDENLVKQAEYLCFPEWRYPAAEKVAA